MERLRGFLSDTILPLSVGVGVVATSIYLYRRLPKQKEAPKRICGVDYPPDTVIVHQSFQGKTIPCLGHFVMKLETYLRIAKIPYQPHIDDFWTTAGPKNKIPWIEYNGHVMGDSQLIINYLNSKLNVDLNKHLSSSQQALAWGVQKWVEEFTYWLNVWTRWCTNDCQMSKDYVDISPLHQKMAKVVVNKMLYAVGVGRHTAEEIGEFMKNDMRQLSTILGDKKYMFGDQPAEVDCAVFGILAQVRWATPDFCPGKQLLINELTNLTAYIERIKKDFWPDWDDRVQK